MMQTQMTRDFEREARNEIQQGSAAHQWMKDRVEVLHHRVSAHDVLSHFGVRLRYGGNREEQISCPFHGKDNKPSARFYPESPRGSSHVWCFVCQEQWDCIKLWKRFSGFEGKFGSLLHDMERSYGIIPPEMPRGAREVQIDEEAEEVERLFEATESRLRNSLPAYKGTGGMRAYLTLGSVLDRLRHARAEGKVSHKKAKDVLRQILAKVRERESSWQGG